MGYIAIEYVKIQQADLISQKTSYGDDFGCMY